MKWRGRERSSNIDDRRGGGMFGSRRTSSTRRRGTGIRLPGRSTAGRGGAGGLLLIAVVVVVSMLLGVNPMSLLTGEVPTNPGTTSSSRTNPPPAAGEDELVDFTAVVLKETEDLWNEVFAASGLEYAEPTLVLYSQTDRSGCGLADARTGPFYCPADQQIYLDLSFYETLRRQFGVSGDFAQAYVLAHEVGHHVQNLTGEMEAFARFRRTASTEEANAYSVRIELQADCYAGVWAAYAGQENLLERGDIEEALNAAEQIGDDAIQNRSQGFAVPRTFTHGTSSQRQEWFSRGFESRDVGACDTFADIQS